MSQDQAIAVVAGVGPGLGAALCRRLAQAGYAVAGLARQEEAGRALAEEVRGAGGEMTFLRCDLTDADAVADAFFRIERDLGAPAVLVYNAGAFLMKPFVELGAAEFQRLWAVNCLGAFLCAQQVVPRMLDRGRGAMVFTGATASLKGSARFAAFAAGKFALRALAQSLARELGPQGIHVAHVILDGIIWTPRTRERPGVTQAKCLLPEAVAETYLHLIGQDRSAWTHELELRPDAEPF